MASPKMQACSKDGVCDYLRHPIDPLVKPLGGLSNPPIGTAYCLAGLFAYKTLKPHSLSWYNPALGRILDVISRAAVVEEAKTEVWGRESLRLFDKIEINLSPKASSWGWRCQSPTSSLASFTSAVLAALVGTKRGSCDLRAGRRRIPMHKLRPCRICMMYQQIDLVRCMVRIRKSASCR